MSVSTRVLRKLRGDQNELVQKKEEESDLDDVPVVARPRSIFNRYNLVRIITFFPPILNL